MAKVHQLVNERYGQLFTEKPRYIILMGGRAAGRSTVASQFALANLLAPSYFRCAIMRYILGDIRNSIYQDIIDRSEEQDVKDNLYIRENLLTISYGKNKISGMGFKKSSSDQKAKLKSLANYNCIIIEEADEVSEEDFMQLDDSIRTLKSDITIILLLNPPSKQHWIIRRWFNLLQSEVEGYYMPELKSDQTDTIFIHTTYRDNIINLNQTTIDNYERYKTNRPDHYYNMIKGLVSEGARGRIFKNWHIVTNDLFNALPYTSFYGLDFGFTNDPTALVEIKTHNEQVWIRELIYETGLTNQRIAQRLTTLGVLKNAAIYADSAEPKSIEEIRLEGWSIRPAPKGADSINAGVDLMLSKEIYYTEGSSNISIESQEYRWALDANKEPTNKPIDDFNHAMDASRYALQGYFEYDPKRDASRIIV
jgi:phage terminase large subunit